MPVESQTKEVDNDLTDLSWLPTALSPEPAPEVHPPEPSPERCTAVLNSTPIQDYWNIVDSIGATEKVSFDLQAL